VLIDTRLAVLYRLLCVKESSISHGKFSIEMTAAYLASFAFSEFEGVVHEVLYTVLCGCTCN